MVLLGAIAAANHCLLARRAVAQSFPAPVSCNVLQAHNSGIWNLVNLHTSAQISMLEAASSLTIQNTTPPHLSAAPAAHWKAGRTALEARLALPILHACKKAPLFTSNIYSATSKKNKQIEENNGKQDTMPLIWHEYMQSKNIVLSYVFRNCKISLRH